MRVRPRLSAVILLLSAAAMAAPAAATPGASSARIRTSRTRLPLAFEENRGQMDAEVRFAARLPGSNLFLTDTGATLCGKVPAESGRPPGDPAVFRLSLAGGARPTARGEDVLPQSNNYFLGSDPRQWRTGGRSYRRVRYPGVYPGIDIVYYGSDRRLEFDFVVAPGSNPSAIRLRLEGGNVVREAGGDLRWKSGSEEIRLHAPEVYQARDEKRDRVPGEFVLLSDAAGGEAREVAFRVGRYDPSRPLVIDPVLLYSTYLGGSDDDEVDGIAVDGEGNAYVTGRAYSLNFPRVGAIQSSFGGNEDTFVAKIDPTGSFLVYSTYLGGSDRDFGNGIAVDSEGNAYVGGRTLSHNFPGTSGSAIQPVTGGNGDGFVTKLNAAGTAILYSTYLGGSDDDDVLAIALDRSGSAYVTGRVSSSQFPGTPGNPIQSSYHGGQDAFVTRIDPTGTTILYSTYLGGSGSDGASAIAVDRAGNAYVAGFTDSHNFPGTAGSPIQPANAGDSDGFVTKINAAGTALVYSTYLGGSGRDGVIGIAVDRAGNACFAGETESANFPKRGPVVQTAYHGGGDAFVARIDASGSSLVYSTFLGGTSEDYADAIAVDSAGNAYVAGYTESAGFPGTSDGLSAYSGNGDGFVVKLNRTGSAVLWGTYLGGSDYDEAYSVALKGTSALVGGVTLSNNFIGASTSSLQPHRGGDYDGFVVRFSGNPPRSEILPGGSPEPAIVGRR